MWIIGIIIIIIVVLVINKNSSMNDNGNKNSEEYDSDLFVKRDGLPFDGKEGEGDEVKYKARIFTLLGDNNSSIQHNIKKYCSRNKKVVIKLSNTKTYFEFYEEQENKYIGYLYVTNHPFLQNMKENLADYNGYIRNITSYKEKFYVDIVIEGKRKQGKQGKEGEDVDFDFTSSLNVTETIKESELNKINDTPKKKILYEDDFNIMSSLKNENISLEDEQEDVSLIKKDIEGFISNLSEYEKEVIKSLKEDLYPLQTITVIAMRNRLTPSEIASSLNDKANEYLGYDFFIGKSDRFIISNKIKEEILPKIS